MAKNVLIKRVDEATYRRAKATAAIEGMSMGKAVSDALALWIRENGLSDNELEYRLNLAFVRSGWKKEFEPRKGKAVVVSKGAIQGAFDSLDEAKEFSRKRFSLALTFVVDRPPEEEPVEMGLDVAL